MLQKVISKCVFVVLFRFLQKRYILIFNKGTNFIHLLRRDVHANVLTTNNLIYNNKEMKKFRFLLIAASAMLLNACELEEWKEPAEETYTKAFIKEFGLIDPEQDWNMATRASVTVSTTQPSEIRVYAHFDNSYRLVGDFGNISGTQNLEFDTPKGVTDIIVTDGTASLRTTIGQSVAFTSHTVRAINTNDGTDTQNNPLGIKVESSDDVVYSTSNDKEQKTGVYYYANYLPENKNNVDKTTDNFQFASGDEEYSFVLYPIYWNTNNVDEIGITYVKDGMRHSIPIYTIKSGNQLEYLKTGNEWRNNVEPSKRDDTPEQLKNVKPTAYTDEQKEIAREWIYSIYDLEEATLYFDNDSYIAVQATKWWEAVVGTGGGYESTYSNSSEYRSRGIKVTVPANVEFAFYIKNALGEVGYSLADLNETVNDKKVPHAATFMNNDNKRCLCFEDWFSKYDSDEPDLNDIVFYTTLATNDNPGGDIEEEDPVSYILAAEDLGNTDDFDFNDMVIKVSSPVLKSGTTGTYLVNVTALAAGGMLPLKLCRNGQVLNSPIEGSTAPEMFHSWFGDGNVSTSTMINTTAFTLAGSTLTLELTAEEKANFTLTSESALSQDVTSKMGGFSFIVDRTGDGSFTEATAITAPKNGEAPQMICVPDTWLWPTERNNISTAYPKFGDWGANYTDTEWLKTWDAGCVIAR